MSYPPDITLIISRRLMPKGQAIVSSFLIDDSIDNEAFTPDLQPRMWVSLLLVIIRGYTVEIYGLSMAK